MSGARGPKVLFGTYSHTRKVQNWGRGGPWPHMDPLLIRVLVDAAKCRTSGSGDNNVSLCPKTPSQMSLQNLVSGVFCLQEGFIYEATLQDVDEDVDRVTGRRPQGLYIQIICSSLFLWVTLAGLLPLVSNGATVNNSSKAVFQVMLSPMPVQSSFEYLQIGGLHNFWW